MLGGYCYKDSKIWKWKKAYKSVFLEALKSQGNRELGAVGGKAGIRSYKALLRDLDFILYW